MQPTVPYRPPLHERIPPLAWVRNPLRNALFKFIQKFLDTDDGRTIVANMLKGLPQGKAAVAPLVPDSLDVPYQDLGRPGLERPPCQRTNAVIITARFRTGSTLLWNLFRNIEGMTAYYEPFNERRWFDPATRGDHLDSTHRRVSDYWREYEGLEELGNYYRESWTRRHLLMEETAWDRDMKRYVEILIEKARGRPVLQFNRIDFRLPWFRRTFPAARIVHLYRHPRDQWCSSLIDPKCFPPTGRMADFPPHDHFYLLSWVRDLKYYFPFLDETTAEHPYQLFYYLWTLSSLVGRKYAHYSLAFGDLLEDPCGQLEALFRVLNVEKYDLKRLVGLIEKPAPRRWKEYADADWFVRHETACETVLAEFFASEPIPATV